MCYQIDNAADIILSQWLEHNDLVQTVQEFGSEVSMQGLHHHILSISLDITGLIYSLEQIIRTDI